MTVEDSPQLGELRRTMSAYAGVIRDKAGLLTAARSIAALERDTPRLRFANIVTTAKLIVAGALMREESRGGHFRSDFPEPNAQWQHRTFMTLDEANRIFADATETATA